MSDDLRYRRWADRKREERKWLREVKARERFWTTGQIAFLRENYASKGAAWCSDNMQGPRRSADAIRWKCMEMKIKRDWEAA